MADEPTGNLDSKSSTAVIEAFLNAKEKIGATIFMVTHDAFSASYADRVIALKDGIVFGELVRHGQPKDFLDELLDFTRKVRITESNTVCSSAPLSFLWQWSEHTAFCNTALLLPMH